MVDGGRTGTDELDPMTDIERSVDEAMPEGEPQKYVVHEDGTVHPAGYLDSEPAEPPPTAGDLP